MHTARLQKVGSNIGKCVVIAYWWQCSSDVNVSKRTTVEDVFVYNDHFLAKAHRGKVAAFLEQSGRQLLKGGGQHHFLHLAVIEGAHTQLGQSVGEYEFLYVAFAEGIVAHALYGRGQCVFALLAHREPEDALAIDTQEYAVLAHEVSVGCRHVDGLQRRASCRWIYGAYRCWDGDATQRGAALEGFLLYLDSSHWQLDGIQTSASTKQTYAYNSVLCKS